MDENIKVLSTELLRCRTTSGNNSAWILEDIADFSTDPALDAPTLAEIFAVPLTSDLQTAFMLGFGLPMIVYLTSWGYGAVVNWFNERYFN